MRILTDFFESHGVSNLSLALGLVDNDPILDLILSSVPFIIISPTK